MPVNDENVRLLIAGALANAGDGHACCGQVTVGFRELQRRRQVPGASLDLDLAAAEHYLFARYLICMGMVGPFQMRALILGYDIKKWIDSARGRPNAMATTDNPVSPRDPGVVRWAIQGMDDGIADHARCNSSVRPPIWRPLEQVFGPGRGVGPY